MRKMYVFLYMLEVKETEFLADVTVVYVVFRCIINLVKENEFSPNLDFYKGLFWCLLRRGLRLE